MKIKHLRRQTTVLTLFCLIRITASAQVQWTLDTVISTGANSSGIAITPDGSKLVVTNNTNPGAVKVISTSNYAVSSINISSIENYPNGVAITPNSLTAIVNTTHKTVFIDLSNNSIKGTFSAPCVGTTLYGLAATPDGSNVIFPDLNPGCTIQGLRSTAASGQSSASTFITDNNGGQLYGIAITPSGSTAVVTGFTHAPTNVNLGTSTIQNITGMPGSYGLAIMNSTNEALIFDGDSLDRVSLTSNMVTKKISNLSYNTSFQNIAITADDKYAFVVGAFEKLIITLADNKVIQTFTSGGTNVATKSDGSKFYVTDSYNGTVRVYKKVSANGMNELRKEISNIVVYPNPTSGKITIYADVSDRKDFEIYNIIGEKVTFTLNFKPFGTNEIDINTQPAGIYFLKINTKEGVITKKIIKQDDNLLGF